MDEKQALIEQFDRELSFDNYSPMNDVLVKFIFGREERKNITIDFLNAVLEPYLGHAIRDITFSQTEQNPQGEGLKLTRLDVACELDTGEFVDVEVQVVNQKNMERRTLYYWSQLYLGKLQAGMDYIKLKPSITVNVLAFSILPQSDPHAVYSVCNIETGERLNRDMELHFLEIPKFAHDRKTLHEMTKMERWLAYFSNKLNGKEREELAMSEAAIKDAYDATKVFLMKPEERHAYINRQMAIMDYNTNVAYAREEGRAEGRVEGRTEGIDRMANLIRCLKEQNRQDDMDRALVDPAYREQLFQEFGL